MKKNTSTHLAYMHCTKLLMSILAVALMFSCSAPKDIVYFQESENLEQIVSESSFLPIYKPHDIISITVTASDPDTAIPFNKGAISSSSENGSLTTNNTSSSPSYLIDSDGTIEFPVLGTLTVAGLSNTEVKEMIKEKLKVYIKDPIVTVQLENFKVTILGEVRAPGPISIANERITIIEALGIAGDLEIQGKRTNITVIREENNTKTIYKADLTSKDIFNSPVYYLAQNDIVYVEPNASRVKSSRNSNWLRVLTSVTSVLGIIISIIAITR